MIKFFRKIRQKLLSENKFSKYLIYAIGEIVLVVIGILIALSLNNWNDSKKKKIEERVLLTELMKNLEINITQIKEDIEWDSVAIRSGKIIMNVLNNKISYSDTLGNHFQNSRLVPNSFLTTSSYKAIENRGFQIVSSIFLRKKIMKLFDDTYPSMILEINNIDENTLKTNMQNYMINHFEYSNGQLKPNDYQELLEDQRYRNILSYNIEIQGYFKWKRIDCLKQVELLIEEIDKELNKEK
mgnify:FL=1